MKRLVFSSDSDNDEIDISKIKEKYQRPKKMSKKEIVVKEKEPKIDVKQMDIKTAFANVNTTKRKSEMTMDTFFKKVPKIDKVSITPQDFFSNSKSEPIQTKIIKETDMVVSTPFSTPPKAKSIKKTIDIIDKSPKIVKKEIEINVSPLKPTIRNSVASDMSSPMSANSKAGFAKFMQRSGPLALGSKEVPEGSPNCLMGLTFVITGVLDSIERDDAQALIEKCGGKVTKAVSGRTSYLVLGTDAGQSKITKANQLKTKQINEDELFELVRSTSSKMSHNSKPVSLKNDTNTKPLVIEEKVKKASEVVRSVKPSIISQTNLTANPIITKPEATSSREVSSTLFVDKYRPTTLKKIVGQHGDRSPANKLLAWLKNFEKNLKSDSKSDDEGSQFRAALLSGPPGIGKTTTARVVCQELGYNIVELNASSVRSKNSIKNTLSDSMRTTSFYQSKGLKHCLIMDEVDGMAGNEDRGGINELIQIIKTTKHPIICICNDRQSRKLQSFVKYVYDLRYRQLTVDQVKATLLSVAFKEKITLPTDAINYIIQASNFDMRQVLNNLQMWSVGNMENETLKTDAKNASKEFKMGPFDVLPKVFSHDSVKTLSDKSDLFFQDYNLGGLFVQENYLQVRPYFAKGDMNKTMKLMSLAADSIAMGDIISTQIRTTNNWTLLPTQAMFSSVIPGEYLHGRLSARIDFPSWLGKYSKTNKNSRILSSLCSHLCLSTKCGVFHASTIAMDYGEVLVKRLTTPLREGDIETVLVTLNRAQLRKDDMDLLIEATSWPHVTNPMASVSTQTKAALTRAYNKSSFKLPYANVSMKKSVKGATEPEFETEDGLEVVGGGVEEDGDDGEEKEEDAIDSDVMIVKKQATKKDEKDKAGKAKKPAAKKTAEPKVPKEKKAPATKRVKK